MNQEVNQYMEKIDQKWQADVCTHLRETVLRSVPAVEELLQYGKPHYKKDGKYVCTYCTAKSWISFTVFNAASLEAPEGILNLVVLLTEGPSRSVKDRRQTMIF